jgi:hypothetical protein
MKEEERQFKGVWIPGDIYRNRELSWSQKLMLVEIDSFSKNGNECFVSNDWLSEHLQIGVSATEKCLKSLVDLGMVSRNRKKFGATYRRTLRLTTGMNSGYHPEPVTGTTRNEVRHTNTETNTPTNPRSIGKPTSEDECVEYFFELGMTSEEAHKFLDWYTQTGWKLKGGNRIKDWKATARNWKRRSNGQETTKAGWKQGNFNPETLHNYVSQG